MLSFYKRIISDTQAWVNNRCTQALFVRSVARAHVFRVVARRGARDASVRKGLLHLSFWSTILPLVSYPHTGSIRGPG
jgi:hypothetical protein